MRRFPTQALSTSGKKTAQQNAHLHLTLPLPLRRLVYNSKMHKAQFHVFVHTAKLTDHSTLSTSVHFPTSMCIFTQKHQPQISRNATDLMVPSHRCAPVLSRRFQRPRPIHPETRNPPPEPRAQSRWSGMGGEEHRSRTADTSGAVWHVRGLMLNVPGAKTRQEDCKSLACVLSDLRCSGVCGVAQDVPKGELTTD